MTFDPCDPTWPQVDIWPHNIGRQSQADGHVWVLRSCYTTWTSYRIFSENDLLAALTPKSKFEPISCVEGVKLMHMHKSRVNATYFVELDSFNDFFDPSDPIVTSDPIIVCVCE